MKITKIVQQKKKKDRVSVFVDGDYSFPVSKETLLKFNLHDGKEISDSFIESVSKEEEARKALDSVFRLLGIRSRSEKELRDKLKIKKLGADAVENAVSRAKELGFINDDKFALERANYLRQKGKGAAYIKFELKKLGITADAISQVFSPENFSKESEVEQIKKMAVIRLGRMGKIEPAKAAQKLMSFFSRRGYDIESIKAGLKAAKLEIEETN